MINSIKLLAVASALVVGSSAFAQQIPAASQPASNSAGLLGQRYAGASFGYLDLNKSSIDAFGAGASVNLPVRSNLDVGFGYARSWVESFSDANVDSIGANATFIHTADNFKTFSSVRLGYDWGFFEDEATTWGASAGAEFAFGSATALTVAAAYDDNFKKGDHGVWSGTAAVNRWLNNRVGVVGSVSLIEGGNIGYTAGVAFRF